jgi:RNA polymerase sigma factor (sigma-70 family)
VTDDELVAATLQGDHDAFAALVGRYDRYVRAAAINVLGAGDEGVDDAAQDAWALAYANLARYRARGQFRHWLARIAANRCRDLRRRRRETVALDLLPGWADPAPGPDDVALAHDLGEALAAALGRLAPSERDAVLLCDRDDLKYREAAGALGVPTAWMGKRVHRGRRKLRRLLAPVATGTIPFTP